MNRFQSKFSFVYLLLIPFLIGCNSILAQESVPQDVVGSYLKLCQARTEAVQLYELISVPDSLDLDPALVPRIICDSFSIETPESDPDQRIAHIFYSSDRGLPIRFRITTEEGRQKIRIAGMMDNGEPRLWEPISRAADCLMGDCLNEYSLSITERSEWYEGGFANGIPNGSCKTMILGDNMLYHYEGGIEDGNFQGQAVLTYSSGTRFEGLMELNQPKQGTMTYPLGSFYQGDFENGFRAGNGVYTFSDGSRIEGGWENDAPNGFGKSWNVQGSLTYEGAFKNWNKSGKGKLILSDYTYEGGFERNVFHGTGSQHFSGGDKKEGRFLKGSFIEGVWTSASGDRYEGKLKPIHPDSVSQAGEGKVQFTDGSSMTGQWDVFGEPSGLVAFNFSHGLTHKSWFFEGSTTVEGQSLNRKELHAYVLFKRGNEFFQSEELEESIDWYSRSLGHSQRFPGVYAFRGICYKRMGQAELAETDLIRALEIQPDWAELIYELYDLHFQASAFEKALVFATRLTTLMPDNPEIWFYRGMAELRLGNTELAWKSFSVAIDDLNGVEPLYRYRRGEAAMGHKDYEKARLDFEHCTLGSAEEADFWYALAMSEEYLLRSDQALEHYEKAMRLKPDLRAVCLMRMGFVQSDAARMDLACALWNQAMDLGNQDAKRAFEANCKRFSDQ